MNAPRVAASAVAVATTRPTAVGSSFASKISPWGRGLAGTVHWSSWSLSLTSSSTSASLTTSAPTFFSLAFSTQTAGQKEQATVEKKEEKSRNHKQSSPPPPPPPRLRQSSDERWESKFSELLEYKRRHSDCSVPAKSPHHKALSKWVNKQRQEYRQWQLSGKSQLKDHRRILLEQAGFCWSVHNTWQARFVQLQDFYQRYGHCHVPSNFADYPGLWKWVRSQRRQYKLLRQSLQDAPAVAAENNAEVKKRKKTNDNQETEKDTDKDEENDNDNDNGEEDAQDEKDSDKEEEDVDKDDDEESSSSSLPRSQASLPQSPLTPERIEALNSLEFIWDYKEAVWMDFWHQLKKYRDYHGDCLVPRKFESNPSLGVWVDRQRQYYKRWRNNNNNNNKFPSSLTEDRQRRLDELGFCWDVHEAAWNAKYGQLEEFVQVNGPVLLWWSQTSSRLPKSLQSWLHMQKRQYQRLQNGRRSPMTPERLEKLQQLGVVFG